jgi:hypothetical protein
MSRYLSWDWLACRPAVSNVGNRRPDLGDPAASPTPRDDRDQPDHRKATRPVGRGLQQVRIAGNVVHGSILCGSLGKACPTGCKQEDTSRQLRTMRFRRKPADRR